MVQHGRIGRRQAGQTGIVVGQPTGKGSVQSIANYFEPDLMFVAVAAMNQRRKLGSFQDKDGPV